MAGDGLTPGRAVSHGVVGRGGVQDCRANSGLCLSLSMMYLLRHWAEWRECSERKEESKKMPEKDYLLSAQVRQGTQAAGPARKTQELTHFHPYPVPVLAYCQKWYPLFQMAYSYACFCIATSFPNGRGRRRYRRYLLVQEEALRLEG